MILLAGGFALGGGPALPTEMDIIVSAAFAGILAGLVVAIGLALIWGGICYWWDVIWRDRVRVRPWRW